MKFKYGNVHVFGGATGCRGFKGSSKEDSPEKNQMEVLRPTSGRT